MEKGWGGSRWAAVGDASVEWVGHAGIWWNGVGWVNVE